MMEFYNLVILSYLRRHALLYLPEFTYLIQCLSLSLLISFSLKSILLDIKMVIPDCILGSIAWNKCLLPTLHPGVMTMLDI